MLNSQRIFFDDNGTFRDLSISLNDFTGSTETLPFVAAEDYVYIATDLPPNHKYFELETANASPSTISVSMWDGKDWIAMVDTLDNTASSGASLGKSGIIRWTPERNKSWKLEQDSEDVSGVPYEGVYNFYWLRIGFSADLDAGTTIKYIGNKFADDLDLYRFYPDLQAIDKDCWTTGKTTWDDQMFTASDKILSDLKTRGVVQSRNQLLDFGLFMEPCVHKAAEIIYGGLGEAYESIRARAKKRYEESMNIRFFNVDVNSDGRLSNIDRRVDSRRLDR